MYIINADDYGISEENNLAILDASKFGILNSTSVMVNTPFCNYDILQELLNNPNFRVGLHLNIFEFKTLRKILKPNSKLYDEHGEYHNSFGSVLKKSFNKEFLEELEEDYRLQIEEALKHFKPQHIDSHVHMHAIPNIFKIVCKLAKEYDIPYVRTQFEMPYFIPDLKMFSKTNLINLIKVCLLSSFTLANKKEIQKYGLNTNDYIVGVQYTSNMDTNTLYYGYRANSKNGRLTEALLHPTQNQQKKDNYKEYLSLLDEKLLLKLQKLLLR
ncbi:ChbG/HpnK family deacetylase [bacterium]|nr:ChbG/HpnK family deacetylase [bacterium]